MPNPPPHRRPVPSRQDHLQFCITEGWVEVPSTHHNTYELELPTGDRLRTRISRPQRRTDTYGPSMFGHILQDQLKVTEADFWACVNDRVLPPRGVVTAPVEAIPLRVLWTLINEAHIPEDQVRAMTKDESIARMAEFYRTGK